MLKIEGISDSVREFLFDELLEVWRNWFVIDDLEVWILVVEDGFYRVRELSELGVWIIMQPFVGGYHLSSGIG